VKRGAVVAAFVAMAAVVATGCGSTRIVTKTVTVPATPKGGLGPPGDITEFGYIKSLARKGAGFELRFDPAWFTSGVTASRAKFEDTGSSDVPNDNYVVDEGHRLLTYLVPATAHVTVITNNGTGILGTPISVSELARIVSGGAHRKLFEPITTGFWMRFHVDTVRSLDQQYVP